MEPWMHDVRVLGRVHEAAARVAANCESILQSTEPPAQGRAKALAAAVSELQALLQDVSAPQAPQPHPGVDATEPAARRAAADPPAPAAILLQLPDELLHRVGRLAGKECRAICSRLRDAYGPPALTVRQPKGPFEVSLLTQNMQHVGEYQAPLEDLQEELLAATARRLMAAELSLEAVATCSARWPGWAAQVTRLELSDTCSPDNEALQRVFVALPGLRQLQLGHTSLRVDHAGAVLPQHAGITHLDALCGVDRVATKEPAVGLLSFVSLKTVPNLRSLHLDLRFLHPGHEIVLELMLRGLQHLTHLELVLGPEGATLPEAIQLAYQGVFETLADRLQSLVLLSSPEVLGRHLVAELAALSRLTTLGWCIGWDEDSRCNQDDDIDWLRVTGARQVVLGYSDGSSSRRAWGMVPDTACLLRNDIHRGGVVPAVESLVLPTLVRLRAAGSPHKDEPAVGLEALFELLEAVAVRCTGLTSLRCGLDQRPGEEQPEFLPGKPQYWLQPVGRMQQLQLLVLRANTDDLGAGLACLAGLPLLGELWLQVGNAAGGLPEERLRQLRGMRDGGSGLAQLRRLRVLGLKVEGHCGGGASNASLAHHLLAAAASLPRLEVLDVAAAAGFAACPEAWQPLAAAPLPALREVRLGCLANDGGGGAELAAHRCTQVLLEQRLPPGGVVAVSGVGLGWEDAWGPLPETLTDLTVKWQRPRG